MKPKQMHQEAMHYSFLARQAFDNGEDSQASEYYARAAEIESDLARFYYDKPELEPTRSTIVRSAAFLNLKAGLIEQAREFIFWGLLYIKDEAVRTQLNEALELSQILINIDVKETSHNVEYWKLLRQRSIYYTLEPSDNRFGSAISLEMVRNFADDYLKSLKAYGVAAFMKLAASFRSVPRDLDLAAKHFEELVNPLLTTTGIGSFKFSIANDFLERAGEGSEVVKLKKNVLIDFHQRIFINPLDDVEIQLVKSEYKDDEIDQIFRPLTRIKKPGSPIKIAYFDTETFHKKYVSKIENAQRRKLLPLKQPSKEDIGILESSIIHTRNLNGGKKTRSLIQREQLKSYEFDIKTNQIDARDKRPLLLNEEIVIAVLFNADAGFTFAFDDLNVELTDTDYSRGLQGFYTLFYEKLIEIINSKEASNTEQLKIVKQLINNIDHLRRR